MKHPPLIAILMFGWTAFLFGDGPGDNLVDQVRPVPPPGIEIPEADRAELQASVLQLGQEIAALRKELAFRPTLLELLPDVQIFHNAVRYALENKEFYDLQELKIARAHLKEGQERVRQLREGNPKWINATGHVVRGYVSRIDGSVQPYGLLVPMGYQPGSPVGYRLDLWCHGRGEKLTELRFLAGHEIAPGAMAPSNAFVLMLYGRYCCANKFAGEIDCLEALTDVRKHYTIDENRLVIRGFSMGGAACWHLAVHYPSLWCAAAPGAGFAETADFLRILQSEQVQPTWYEQKLWNLYDCPGYAMNFFNLPVVAYSGEIDKQRQAAEIMTQAMAKEGLTLAHLIGPKTAHAYHAQTRRELNEHIDRIAAHGRECCPRHIRFSTYTLRYNESHWLRVDALNQHWERATMDAEVIHEDVVQIKTHNVHAFTMHMLSGSPLFPDPTVRPRVSVDGTTVEQIPPVLSDRSWIVHIEKAANGWTVASNPVEDAVRKRHGMQGPIDDAFLDSFLIVKPTGKPFHDATDVWAKAECEHLIEHWRLQFRGEARSTTDVALNAADIATHNLVLWGDPGSNKVLAKMVDRLPIHWDAESVRVGQQTFPTGSHMPILIYPNPLNPRHYVVLNSGFTFREYDYLNNARQVPRLPDFAVIDVRTPRTSRGPGKVVAAGFFDENWHLQAGQ